MAINRVDVIQSLLNKLGGQNYLEIGVCQGSSFFPVQANFKIGIDPAPSIKYNWRWRLRRRLKNFLLKRTEKIYKITSDEFFDQHGSLLRHIEIDVAFVDGLHTFEQSLKDVKNCLNYLRKDGVIVLHDCNPSSESAAHPGKSIDDIASKALPDWDGRWNGDVWKTIVYLRSTAEDLSVMVLDCDSGLGLVTRSVSEEKLNYSIEQIIAMKYEDLNIARKALLNLKPPEEFRKYLENI